MYRRKHKNTHDTEISSSEDEIVRKSKRISSKSSKPIRKFGNVLRNENHKNDENKYDGDVENSDDCQSKKHFIDKKLIRNTFINNNTQPIRRPLSILSSDESPDVYSLVNRTSKRLLNLSKDSINDSGISLTPLQSVVSSTPYNENSMKITSLNMSIVSPVKKIDFMDEEDDSCENDEVKSTKREWLTSDFDSTFGIENKSSSKCSRKKRKMVVNQSKSLNEWSKEMSTQYNEIDSYELNII